MKSTISAELAAGQSREKFEGLWGRRIWDLRLVTDNGTRGEVIKEERSTVNGACK